MGLPPSISCCSVPAVSRFIRFILALSLSVNTHPIPRDSMAYPFAALCLAMKLILIGGCQPPRT